MKNLHLLEIDGYLLIYYQHPRTKARRLKNKIGTVFLLFVYGVTGRIVNFFSKKELRFVFSLRFKIFGNLLKINLTHCCRKVSMKFPIFVKKFALKKLDIL